MAIDIDSVRVSAELRIANEGDAVVALKALDFKAGSAAPSVHVERDLASVSLVPGASTASLVVFDFDAPAGTAPLIPMNLEATVSFTSAGSGSGAAAVSYAGEFPRIMPPELHIASIRILKDELINTRLRVDLEILNPNIFPLSFAALDYKLFGEGRYWASDSLAKAFAVPALQTATASLYLTMNFTDMSRSLLDQVIKLSAVKYRLTGAGRIDTGLDFLPQFTLPFDMAGRTQVLK
jgi:LEA14-like dessication related protein